MSTIVRCYPNGTTASTHASVTGAADVDDALRDTDDSDYVDLTGAGSSSFDCTLEDIPALGANQRIARARIVAKVGMVGSGNAHTSFNLRQSTTDKELMNKTGVLSGTYTSGWTHIDPVTGVEFTETNVNSLHLKCIDPITSGQPRFRWARMEVDIQDKPIAAISNPTPGTTVPIIGGYIRWAPDETADAVYRYQAKIFSLATVTGGGFDPETSTPDYDTGEQLYTGANTIPFPSTTFTLSYATTYFAYIKISVLFNGGVNFGVEEWWGDWSAGVNFTTDSIPGVAISSPSGTVNTSQPIITYAYADADGKVPFSVKVRIFKSTNLPPGDDPDDFSNGGPIYNSPPLDYLGTTVDPGRPILSNGLSYRIYGYPVMPNFSPGLLAELGALGFSDITASWTPPATPTLTVTHFPLMSAVQIVLKNNYNDASARVFCERSDDGGVTWHGVGRAVDSSEIFNLNIGYNTNATFFDYEAPPNVAVQYRAYINATVSAVKTQSAYATATVTTAMSVAWLKNPLDHTQNMHVVIETDLVPRKKVRRGAIFEPIGRSTPIVQKVKTSYETVAADILVTSLAEETKLRTLLDSGDTLLLQLPRSWWYVELIEDYTVDEYPWTDKGPAHKVYERHFKCSFVQVPTVSLVDQVV